MKGVVVLVCAVLATSPLWADGPPATQKPEQLPVPRLIDNPPRERPTTPAPPVPVTPIPDRTLPRHAPDDCQRRPLVSPLLLQVEQLQAERRALADAYDAAQQALDEGLERDVGESALLKLRVKELLGKLGKQHGVSPKTTPATTPLPPGPLLVLPPPVAPLPPPTPAAPSAPATPRLPLEPLALAHALFRAGNYEGALQAYRMTELKGARAEERAPVQYLIACCLRRLGKTEEAANLYREIANVKGDEQVAACARWQLAALRWQQETTARLREIRDRRLALEKEP
jgi:tetratricopeptide (TPR) repeat protein